MNTYQVTCREWSYFIKEVEANSEDEARKKIHNNVNGFKTTCEWTSDWEIDMVEDKNVVSTRIFKNF